MVSHLMVTINQFSIVGPYTLRVVFDDGAEQTINFEPVLHGYYYAPLRNIEFFNAVRLDTEIGNLVWPNGADFDPATLYQWHAGDGAELARRVAQWPEAIPGVSP